MNITSKGARRRRREGVVALVVALVVAVLLAWLDAPRAWRLVLAIPLAVGVNGLLQAREGTCVALAAAGLCELEGGGYARVSGAARAQDRRKMWWILARAVGIAAALTAITLAV